jgi:hypothetical protein
LGNPSKVEEAWNAYADDWFRKYGLSQVDCLVNYRSNEILQLEAVFRRLWKRLRGTWCDGYRSSTLKKLGKMLLSRLNRLGKIQHPKRTTSSTVANSMIQEIARLRNKFDTLAHRELYLTALSRAMTRDTADWPAWARELFEKWGVIS